jgi:hypothetical protein
VGKSTSPEVYLCKQIVFLDAVIAEAVPAGRSHRLAEVVLADVAEEIS